MDFPLRYLIQSDSYGLLSKGLLTAYAVGRVDIFDKTFVHLAFTEATADWQLWVEPGDKPLPRRLEIVYKTEDGKPRISIDLTDWNLNASTDPSIFSFNKPEGAHRIDLLPAEGEK